MEVEDPLSAKFRTLIERLMVATTSEIVKIFSKVLLETRVEITRSWKEIDLLKQHLEKCEQEKREAIIRAQRSDFKREDDEMEVSQFKQSYNSDKPRASGSKARTGKVSKDRCISVGKTKVTAQSSKPGSSGKKVKTQKTNSPKTKCTEFVARRKVGRPPKKQKSMSISSHTIPITVDDDDDDAEASASVDFQTTSPKVKEMKKENVTSTPTHPNDANVSRGLRDRQHLGMQRHCLCCSSDECNKQSSPSKAQHQVPTVYICRKCERRFKTDLQFKSHKCSMPQNCDKCGQVFNTLQGLFTHRQEVQPPLSCSQCEEKFATLCAWAVHKKIHTNLIIPKEIKSKRFEVRLERISDSQLEAALCSSGSYLQNNSSKQNNDMQNVDATETNNGSACERGAESTMENLPDSSMTQPSSQSSGESLLDSSGGQSSVRKVYAVMSSTSCQIQISKDASGSEPSTACENEKVTDDEKLPSDESGLYTPPRKRRMAECSHDAYNGVFPVENILRWRNNKGKNEVRVKWLPCTLCGAKFQNTWEPAESFPGYLDDKNEEPKKN